MPKEVVWPKAGVPKDVALPKVGKAVDMPKAGTDDEAPVLGVDEGVVVPNPVPNPVPKPADGVGGATELRALGLKPKAADVAGADGT